MAQNETDPTTPKPSSQPAVKSREVRANAKDEAAMLASVGTRLAPDGLIYVGSFASHIYRQTLSTDFIYLSQTTDLRPIPDQVTNIAIKELARKVMIAMGHKPPAKRGDVLERDV